MRIHMRTLIVLSILLFGCGLAQAQERVIVDVDYLQEAAKRKVILWDVRSAEDYRKGHIPGAINIGDVARVLREENTEDFIAVERIEKILGAAGLDPAREIIAYGFQGSWNPYFARYTMRYFGGRHTRVFHDGIEGWVAAGLRQSSEMSRLSPVTLTLQVDPTASVSTRDMIARLSRPDVQILDVRTPKEFLGEDIRAIRGGHIPGAINIPYEQNWKDPGTSEKLTRGQVSHTYGMSLKPLDQLRALYSRLDPEKETIVYCQSGVRASETAGVLQHLGFRNVKVYDSSWLGYGNTLDAPASNVTFFNVGLMNNRVGALQARIEQLERELAEARVGKK
jgi:thiosulfate/3-mercaptopyruvate sulfurtransferase